MTHLVKLKKGVIGYCSFAMPQLGESLIKKNHPAKGEIRQRVASLMSKWNELLQASNNRGKGLEEARDILEFNEQVDKVEMWIREKVRSASLSASKFN